MVLESPKGPGSAPFRWLGGFVYRRRKYIIVAWIIALIAVVPLVINEGKVTSLQLGSASGQELESVRASDLIAAQFAKAVPNSTLIVVITGDNVSSPGTQAFVQGLTARLKADNGIHGLNQTLDVYSTLYSAIRSVNTAAHTAANGANGTARLLFGVPALYLGAWQQAYATTQNVTKANGIAYATASGMLTSPNATALLNLFNSAWTETWSNQYFASVNLTTRATMAARTAGYQYINAYGGSARAFSFAVLQYFTIANFQSESKLSSFAVGYVSNSTGFSQRFVDSSYELGRSYSNSSLYSLTGDIIWRPSDYAVGRQLSTLISSLVSPGRDTTIITLSLNISSDENIVALRSAVSSALSGSNSASGVQSALVTGDDAISYDFGNSAQDDLALILPVTIILLIVATGLFFRSALTPFITLGTIGLALGISQVFIVLVGTFVAKVDFTVPTILLTILIGVGTDYSVFIIARYREERVKGAEVQDAIGTSVTWAGESITTSGATVIISFLALAVTSVVFLKTIGYVVGLGVLTALLVALTLVPAIVSMVGGSTFWPYAGERFRRYSTSVLAKLQSKKGYFSRSGSFAVKHGKTLIVLAMVATGPALYVYATTAPTFDFISAAPSSLESVAASNHLADAFGGGKLFPSYVVMTFDQPVVSSRSFNIGEMATIGAAASAIAVSPDVRNVTAPTMPYGQTIDYRSVNYSTPSGKQMFNAVVSSIGADNKTVLFTINFGIDPYSTKAISDTQALRQYLHSNFDSAPGVTGVYVGGASGSILDTKNFFDSQFNLIVPVVAVGVALVLLVVLGSLFLPVFAVLSVLMSIIWTLAATNLVFHQLYNYQLLFLIPFFLFVALLGLGMDYNIFILTRIREEATKGKHLDDAIVAAMEQTGGIITAAAIILAGSLGALMLSSDLLLKEVGFAFAYSILIDALVVRTYLVPAVMSTVGKWNWYNPVPYLNRSRSLYDRERTPSSTS